MAIEIEPREGPAASGYRTYVSSERERTIGGSDEVTSTLAPTAPAGHEPASVVRHRGKSAVSDMLTQLNPRAVASGHNPFPLVVFSVLLFVTVLQGEGLIVVLPEAIAMMAGLSITVVVAIQAAVSTVFTMSLPGLGYIADRYRIRMRFLRSGHLTIHLFTMMLGMATGAVAYISTLMLRAVGTVLITPGATVLADCYPVESRLRVGIYMAKWGQVALIVGAPFAGLLTALWGWQWALMVLGMLGLAATLLTFFVPEPVQGAMDRRAAGADDETASHEQPRLGFDETLRSIWSVASLRRLYLAAPFIFVILSQPPIFLQLYFSSVWRLGPGTRGLIASGIGAAGLLGAFLVTPFVTQASTHRPGRMLTLASALSIALGGLVVAIAAAPVLWVAIPLACIAGGLVPLIAQLVIPMLLVVPPARVRTTASELFTFFGVLPLALYIGYLGPQAVNALVPLLGMTIDPAATGLLIVVPACFIAAYLFTSTAPLVEPDIRAAVAVSMADEVSRRARESDQSKMLVCRDVDVSYDGAQVVFGVDLDVHEGEILSLLGTNGSGKSTLLRAICGLQPASNGAIFLDGVDITHAPTTLVAERGVVMVPGGHAVFPRLTVEENLRAAAWMYRRDKEHVNTRVAEVLDYFPILRERYHEVAGNMSGGEQQMLAISQAFLMKPRLLMIDELSLGLAPQVVEQLLGIIRRIHQQGTTIILVEQSVNIALSVAERAVFLEKGEIRFDGPARELLEHREILRSVFLAESRRGTPRSASRRPSSTASVSEVLHAEGVEVRFGGVKALDGVSLVVSSGEVVGFAGPNGAGKTTLFDVMSGYVRPVAGDIYLLGNRVTDERPDARARMGLTRSFQNVRLFPALTVRENIAIALDRNLGSRSVISAALYLPGYRTSERRGRRRVESLIDLLGLGAYADKFLSELSTGTRRVVDIACILATSPQVLLLDEPSSGLAQAETEELGPFIARVSRELGCAVLVIEHDIPLLTAVSDRLVVMAQGTILRAGDPHVVLQDPAVASALTAGADTALARSGTLPGPYQAAKG